MPTQLSITDFFAGTLGAPLHNSVWSWGAVRPQDGAIFLRCWSDKIQRVDGMSVIEIQRPADEDRKTRPGWNERSEHIVLMRAGRTAYAVIVTAKNVNASPRQIDFYNAKEVFQLGQIIEFEGDTYAEMLARLPIRDVRRI